MKFKDYKQHNGDFTFTGKEKEGTFASYVERYLDMREKLKGLEAAIISLRGDEVFERENVLKDDRLAVKVLLGQRDKMYEDIIQMENASVEVRGD